MVVEDKDWDKVIDSLRNAESKTLFETLKQHGRCGVKIY